MKNAHWLVLLLLLPFLLTRCAQVAQPPGGKKDTLAPVLVKSIPLNRQLNYGGRVVELAFDEYVAIENLQQKTVITPQDSNTFETKILPQGLRITFAKPLLPNTTYTINFSDAVKDITERNVATDTKVVFSTGATLDSLGLSGSVEDAESREPAENVVVGLFAATDTLPITRKRPQYFARTDTSGRYQIENVKGGRYRVYAFDDNDVNLVNNAPGERVGFRDSLLTIDRQQDNVNLTLFRGAVKPRIVRRERTDETMGFEFNIGLAGYTAVFGRPVSGSATSTTIVSTSAISTSVASASAVSDSATVIAATVPPNRVVSASVVSATNTAGSGRDSAVTFQERDRFIRLFKPAGRAAGDTLFVTFRALDSLGNTTELRERVYFSPLKSRARDRAPFGFDLTPTAGEPLDNNLAFELTFSKPVARFAPERVAIYADSTKPEPLTAANFQWSNNFAKLKITKQTRFNDTLYVRFPKGTFISVQGDTAAATKTRYRIADPDSYGLIAGRVVSDRVKPGDTNLIVELLDERYKIMRTVSGSASYNFTRLRPGRYRLRVTLDRNKNGRRDTGDVSKQIQPEEVIYFPELINLKQNFELTDLDI
jgi:uncharacterized protein (DUF2141 family)